jgi:carbamoyl-phosphate synthase small subunit
MMNKPAFLVLADGSVYEGQSIGADGETFGELVFNTSMTGYQEIISDPSYCQQIVTLTAAQVGNTGCNQSDMESYQAWAAGLVIRHNTKQTSNYRAEMSLSDWLKSQGIVAIAGIDTRELTFKIRSHGAISAVITTNADKVEAALEKAKQFPGLEGLDLASVVSRKERITWKEDSKEWKLSSKQEKYHIVAYDFGVKHNILRLFYDSGCDITLVPAKTEIEDVLALNPDGVLLSNGPGDPLACDYAIKATKKLLEAEIPVFGICLGFQILALACGAKTVKMKFGHHGANHPVVETAERKRVFITSQNHGFAVDEASLPKTVEVTHRSLFDNTLQGIQVKNKPAFGFQGHPEASPGPHDLVALFDDFIEAMKKYRA